jgi:hypothetical protein
MTAQEFVDYVRSYAVANYDHGGWDEVVEAWSDSDILEHYNEAKGDNVRAFRALARLVKIRKEYADDIYNA